MWRSGRGGDMLCCRSVFLKCGTLVMTMLVMWFAVVVWLHGGIVIACRVVFCNVGVVLLCGVVCYCTVCGVGGVNCYVV